MYNDNNYNNMYGLKALDTFKHKFTFPRQNKKKTEKRKVEKIPKFTWNSLEHQLCVSN